MGSHLHSRASYRGRQPLRHHTATSLCPQRSGRVAPQPCNRPAPATSAGRSGRRGAPPRLPDLPSQPATAGPPHPSRAASPSEGDPRQLLAAVPPAALAATAEGGLPAPSSGGGGAGAAGAAPGPCRGGARREALPQVSEGLPCARAAFSRPRPLESRGTGEAGRAGSPQAGAPPDRYLSAANGGEKHPTPPLFRLRQAVPGRTGVARTILRRRNPAPGPGTVSSRPLDSRVCFPSRARPVGVRRRLARLPPRRGKS